MHLCCRHHLHVTRSTISYFYRELICTFYSSNYISDRFLLKTLIQHALFLLEKSELSDWFQLWALLGSCKYTQINYCTHSFGNVMFWLRETSEIRLLWKQLFIFMTELEMRVCLSQQSADSTQMKLNTIVYWSKSQMHIGETLSQFSICSHFLLWLSCCFLH